jgi:hypothetical protein
MVLDNLSYLVMNYGIQAIIFGGIVVIIILLIILMYSCRIKIS